MSEFRCYPDEGGLYIAHTNAPISQLQLAQVIEGVKPERRPESAKAKAPLFRAGLFVPDPESSYFCRGVIDTTT